MCRNCQRDVLGMRGLELNEAKKAHLVRTLGNMLLLAFGVLPHDICM
jgi:hypothetical protein